MTAQDPPSYTNPYEPHDEPFDISMAKHACYGCDDEKGRDLKNPHAYEDDEVFDTVYGGDDRSRYPSDSTYHDEDRPTPAKRHSYTDDDQRTGQYAPVDAVDSAPLVREMPAKKGWSTSRNMEYADPEGQEARDRAKAGPLGRFFNSARYPLQQRIEDKKRGIGRQKHPFVVYILTVAMIAVFIYELVYNSQQQGSPISLKPVINPMLGPSSSALISLGARFPPCMKLVQQVPPSTNLACANNTANPVTEICTVADLCAFGGIPPSGEPNQWFRFITPIFLHAGIIHILLNMLSQVVLSGQIEREMGSGGFLLTYFSAGIFGNVLGGNFSLVGVPSVGASGAIFGTLAVTWVDLFAHWKYHYRPVRKLIFMTIELLIGFAIGYIPYLDNFAHIGGFVMGLLVGTFFYPVISETKRHRTIMWVFRLVVLPLAIILFVVLVRNFYTSDPYAACSGCRYLSCFPSAANNRCQGTGITMTSSNN
ncbi:hypothetical protein CPB83DRAFT_841646 [Crepidotus variabilis]|uniref:Rhomboid-type serine protease n=1 Tax=Crepidotus variabilis TaxID=179855 RepID=A0A9P6EVA1_9AGAR|nr:hypothetical protein CPB83DRAFT_841646 [Crepidotus variabilis]